MPTAKGGYVTDSGVKLPSVTTALSAVGFGKEGLMYWAWDLGRKGFDYKDLRSQAADIGTIVHDRIHADLLGKPWDEAEFDPKFIVQSDEPFEVYRAWRDKQEIAVILAEENITSETLGFGGTPDFLCRMNGRVVLIDVKTSNGTYETHVMQVAAYCRLIETERRNALPAARIDDAMILQIGKDGSFNPKIVPPDLLALAWSDFASALDLYRNNEAYKEFCARPKKSKKAAA